MTYIRRVLFDLKLAPEALVDLKRLYLEFCVFGNTRGDGR